jgi:hypothetical protein
MSPTTKNPWFNAKKLLIADYTAGRIIDHNKAETVRLMRDEYKLVQEKRFVANYNTLKKGGFKKKPAVRAKGKAATKHPTNSKKKQTPWSIAKPIARQEYLDGHISDDVDLDLLHETKSVYRDVPIKQFKNYMDKLIKRTKKEQEKAARKEATKKKPNYWLIAKPLVHDDYKNGIITDDMDLKDVHKMKDEYKVVDEDRFVDNVSRLIKRIKKDKGLRDVDYAGYLHDMKIYKLAKDIDGEWHGSAAEKLLKEDVTNNIHKTLKPRRLRMTRQEYKDFDLDVFRPHIYQESRAQVSCHYGTRYVPRVFFVSPIRCFKRHIPPHET